MRIKTGQGTIPLITLIGIWSISALNALPGLAVSPILGKLSAIFPHSTELDIQMLSSLPSLLIIPFIGEADGKGQQHLVVTNRVEHLRRQRSIVSAVNQDVAADCSKRPAGHRFGTDCSAIDRLNFTVFRRGIPDKTVRSEFRHHQRYTGPGNHPDRLFGGGELASAVPGLSISVDIDRAVVLSEKEYRSPTRSCNSFGEKQNYYC